MWWKIALILIFSFFITVLGIKRKDWKKEPKRCISIVVLVFFVTILSFFEYVDNEKQQTMLRKDQDSISKLKTIIYNNNSGPAGFVGCIGNYNTAIVPNQSKYSDSIMKKFEDSVYKKINNIIK